LKVLVISIANPILVGIYDNNNQLIKQISKEGKTSDILPLIFEDILNQFDIKELFYVNGPGSYMSIKVSYVFLKTLSIIKELKFFGAEGFYFNNNSPIKALGKKYFFKKEDSIEIDFLNDCKIEEFSLPKVLDNTIFKEDAKPLYVLPAV
jgi:tRNA A37 threonylcarbamoyladenosine modification protein TsaB